MLSRFISLARPSSSLVIVLLQIRNVGKTLVTRSSGMRVATEYLKGRVVEANLADLNKDEDQNYRKIKLQMMVSRRRLAFGVRLTRPAGHLRKELPLQLLRNGHDH